MPDATHITTDALKHAHFLIAHIVSAAESCRVNYHWLRVNGASGIAPLLDFDVIFGALPSRAIHTEASSPDHLLGELQFQRYVGPHTLKHVLARTPVYALPPGTAWELIERIGLLSGGLSHKARTIVDAIFAARESADPVAAIMNIGRPGATLMGALKDEIVSFAEQLADIELLESIMTKSRDLEFFVGSRSDSDTGRTFRKSLKYLNSQRPEVSRSNYYDALNIAFTSRAFREADDKKKDHLPVLISETKYVHDLEEMGALQKSERYGPSPHLINGNLYFLIASGILDVAAYNAQLAADYAELLSSEARSLGDTMVEFMERLPRGWEGMRAVAVSELEIDDDYELLSSRFQGFMGNWGKVIQPARQLIQSDRIEYINRAFGRTLSDGSTFADKRALRDQLRSITASLEADPMTGRSIWRLLYDYYRRDPENLAGRADALYELSCGPNDGTRLSDASPRFGMDQLQRLCCAAEHDVRVLVHDRFMSMGAFLAIDKWASSAASGVGITWSHSRTVDRICAMIAHIFSAVSGKCIGGELLVRCFTRVGEKSSLLPCGEPEILTRCICSQDGLGSVEVLQNGLGVFADISASDSGDFEAGIVGGWDILDPSVIAHISTAIASTSDAPIVESACHALIQKAASLLMQYR